MENIELLRHLNMQLWVLITLAIILLFKKILENIFTMKASLYRQVYANREPIYVETVHRCEELKAEIYQLLAKTQNNDEIKVKLKELIEKFSILYTFISKHQAYYPEDMSKHLKTFLKLSQQLLKDIKSATLEKAKLLDRYRTSTEIEMDNLNTILRCLLQSNHLVYARLFKYYALRAYKNIKIKLDS